MKKLIGTQDEIFPWVLHPGQLFDFALEKGITAEQALNETGLMLNDIEDVQLNISWQQYQRLAMNIEIAGIDSWPLEFGQRLDFTSNGLISLLALNCCDWGELLELLEVYPVLISPVFYVERRETDDYLYLTIYPEFSRDRELHKSMVVFLMLLNNTFKRLGGLQVVNDDELFIYARQKKPDYLPSAESHYNIVWGAYADYVCIPKRILNLTIPNANPLSARSTRRILQAQLGKMPALTGGLHELRLLFKQGVYNLEACAEALFTTVSTLKRYLNGASTSFSRELMEYRIDEACWSAAYSDISIGLLADRLGFHDVNSLSRLFKKEVGFTFSEYRLRSAIIP